MANPQEPQADNLESIKFRVVGALIILLTSLIAWWLILDHDLQKFDALGDSLQHTVDVQHFAIPAETVERLEQYQAEAANTPATKVATNQPSSASQTAQTSNATQLKLKDAWVLQLGVFKDKNNAHELRKTLHAANLSAYVKTFSSDNDTVYRVLVGPKLIKSELLALKPKVIEVSGIEPMLVKFKPGFEQ